MTKNAAPLASMTMTDSKMSCIEQGITGESFCQFAGLPVETSGVFFQPGL